MQLKSEPSFRKLSRPVRRACQVARVSSLVLVLSAEGREPGLLWRSRAGWPRHRPRRQVLPWVPRYGSAWLSRMECISPPASFLPCSSHISWKRPVGSECCPQIVSDFASCPAQLAPRFKGLMCLRSRIMLLSEANLVFAQERLKFKAWFRNEP